MGTLEWRRLIGGPSPLDKFRSQKGKFEKWDWNGVPRSPLLFLDTTCGFDMTRFFFHVRDDRDGVSRDSEGQELPDLEAARREALNSNREMLGERLLHGGSLGHRQIEIANEKGDVLAVLNAKDTLFQEDQLRSFNDDVAKSAPTFEVNTTSSKPAGR
jgi:hypothetical protein